ncbi:fibulin-7-like [Rhinophrynus dorsalis]
MLKSVLLLSVSLHLLLICKGQACPEQREAVKALRQVQKLLADHEASYLRGLKALNRRLTNLKDQLLKGDKKETCPRLKAPHHGRILGGKLMVGHEIHFLCNPGYRLLGSETRTCLHNQTWSGQTAICTGLASVTNTSFLLPAKCSSFQGTQHCTCDPGYLIQSGAVCQDIDECSLFQSKWDSKICAHECINTPGSYQCICPHGYLLDPHQNSCQDIDECVSEQNSCTGEERCVNLFGGFVCVRPECPKPKQNVTYVKISGHQCERTPCLMGSSSCLDAPHSISFHYIAVQSQLQVPRLLFTMTAPRSLGDSQRFSITKAKGQRGLEVRQAGRHRGELVLNKSLIGPAELQVDVEMAEMSSLGILGKHIFSVTIYVSQYPF